MKDSEVGSGIDQVQGWVKQAAKGIKMKARIVYLTMALVMAIALVAVAAPVVGPGISPVQAANTVLDGRTWYYWNDPGGDGCHEGGLGQSSGDTSKDSSGALESVEGVLQWTFNGSAGIAGDPDCPPNDASWFDLILPLDGESWSNYKAIKFDVRTTSTGGPSVRDYLRVDVKLDEVGSGPVNYFNDEDKVWSAHKLDVGHNGATLDDKHKWLGGCTYDPYADPPDECVDIYCDDGIWPQPEHNAERTGWSTFELNFDHIKDSRGGFWANPGQYDCGNDWDYGEDVCGEDRSSGFDGIIERDNLESFRFMISFWSPRWIATDETITVYFDNIELVPAEGGGDGCFIATAAYGTSTAAEIDTLRAFRDEVLLENSLGSQLVTLYYEVSPPLADFISEHDVLRTLVRELLVEPVAWVVEATGTLWGN